MPKIHEGNPGGTCGAKASSIVPIAWTVRRKERDLTPLRNALADKTLEPWRHKRLQSLMDYFQGRSREAGVIHWAYIYDTAGVERMLQNKPRKRRPTLVNTAEIDALLMRNVPLLTWAYKRLVAVRNQILKVMPVGDIATEVGATRDEVYYWVKLYGQGGVEKLLLNAPKETSPPLRDGTDLFAGMAAPLNDGPARKAGAPGVEPGRAEAGPGTHFRRTQAPWRNARVINAADIAQIDALLKREDEVGGRACVRLRAVKERLLDDGTRRDVANRAGVHPSKADRWFHRYCDKGVEGVLRYAEKGRIGKGDGPVAKPQPQFSAEDGPDWLFDVIFPEAPAAEVQPEPAPLYHPFYGGAAPAPASHLTHQTHRLVESMSSVPPPAWPGPPAYGPPDPGGGFLGTEFPRFGQAVAHPLAPVSRIAPFW